MAKNVEVSQKVLFTLVGLLVVCLVAIGFLLGRQSGPSQVERPGLTPTPVAIATPIPLVGQAEQSLDSRVDALDRRVGALRPRVGQPLTAASPQSTPVDLADLEARKTYFDQLDTILGRSAFDSPQPFATRLLEQGMNGDENQLKRVLSQSIQATRDVEAVEAPRTCREHKELILAQLSHAVDVLKKVQAIEDGSENVDLVSLSNPDEKTMSENLKLQKLDRSLRP